MPPKKVPSSPTRRSLRDSLLHIPQRQSVRTPAPNQENESQSRRKQAEPKRKKLNAMKEIKQLQKITNLIIPKAPFSRLVRETIQNCSYNVTQITPAAFEALRESTEAYLVNMFEDSYRITLNRNQVTLQTKDLELLRYIRGPRDPGAM